MSSLISAGAVTAVIAAVVAAVVATTTDTTQHNNRDMRTQTTKDTMRRQDTNTNDAIGFQGQQDTNNQGHHETSGHEKRRMAVDFRDIRT